MWRVHTLGGSPYVDLQTDDANAAAWANPVHEDDLVGGFDTNSAFFPTAYWALGNQHLMFRMRVDDNPDGNNVWTVLLETDGDPNLYVDYIIQVDAQTDDRVEIAPTSGTGLIVGPTSATPWGANNTLDNTPAEQIEIGSIAAYSRFSVAGDGSRFDEGGLLDYDYFVDVAIPLAQLRSVVGWGTGTHLLHVAFGSSASHATMNKDKPDGNQWADPILVPEPGTGLLFLLLAAAGLYRRAVRRS